jgi:hypothetical protein
MERSMADLIRSNEDSEETVHSTHESVQVLSHIGSIWKLRLPGIGAEL